jgi:ubiquitin-protein ligase
MRKSPRDRRLNADFQAVQQLQADSTIFSFSASGSLPQSYRFYFRGLGLKLSPQGRVVIAEHHEVVVELGAAYPRLVPGLAWQTPVFHPNISHNGVVCLGGYGTHWVPSLTLSEMCIMLWDMIRYKNFDTESPYNREAANWAKQQTEFPFPLDRRPLRDRIALEQHPAHTGRAQPLKVKELQVGETIRCTESEIIESGIEIIETRFQSATDEILYID